MKRNTELKVNKKRNNIKNKKNKNKKEIDCYVPENLDQIKNLYYNFDELKKDENW